MFTPLISSVVQSSLLEKLAHHMKLHWQESLGCSGSGLIIVSLSTLQDEGIQR